MPSSSSNPPRPSQPKKAKVKKQPKVLEKKTTQAEPQKPIHQPSPPADIPQKRPFPPLSSPSSDSDSGEEGVPEKNALLAPKPVQEYVQPPHEGVVQRMMTGFTPHTAAASSSSSSYSESSSDASSSDAAQEVRGKVMAFSRHRTTVQQE